MMNFTSILTLAMLLAASPVQSSQNFVLLEIKCDGTLIKSDFNNTREIMGKIEAGDIQSGVLANNLFYTISSKNELLRTDLNSMETNILIDSRSINRDELQLWELVHVGKNKIILSAYKYNYSDATNKRAVFYLLQFDLITEQVVELRLNHDANGWVSKNQERIYYSDANNEIYCLENDKINKLGIDGRRPTVSPDGSMLAFISYGILMEGVYIYDLNTKKIRAVKKFFGPRSVVPKIRWSEDSKLLAIRKNSDLFVTPIYVIDIMNLKTVGKAKDSNACNWFLIALGAL